MKRGAYCAWQVHYHIVFPMKYRKALQDDEVTAIIRETATELAERFPIELEAIGTDKNHIHLLRSAFIGCSPQGIRGYCHYELPR
ncbi:transposase [Nitrospira sp. BLG_1]|uniref:transposase n=1 Tax=Nitrospira sp. BLG_1 TaxID=3395883 RepID=UPI0039BD64FB